MTILKNQTNKISYDEAVTALNSLQTNAITLKKTRKERQKNVHLNLPITRKNFERSGMTFEDLDKMKIIHVSGTKGKGSTCAFCESILRHSGLKTGFYSSPHLVSVTERIRINGKPIEQVKDKEIKMMFNLNLNNFRKSSRHISGEFMTKFVGTEMKRIGRPILNFSPSWPSTFSGPRVWTWRSSRWGLGASTTAPTSSRGRW